MKESAVYVYSDASFSKKHGFGIGGFLIFEDEQAHERGDGASGICETQRIEETNNIRVELRSAIAALWVMDSMLKRDAVAQRSPGCIHFYTDSRSMVQLSSRRKRLEESQYISKAKGTVLANADLYKGFFAVCDTLHPHLHWVKGHSPQRSKNAIDRNFCYLDKLVRKELRKTALCEDGNAIPSARL